MAVSTILYVPTVDGVTGAGAMSTYLVPAAGYLTTAGLSAASSNYAGIGETVGTVAGTDIAITMDTAGLSLAYPKALTTAMASNRGTDFVQATAAFAGTSASGTINSTGISVSIGAYLTTAANSTHSHGNPTLALTNLSGTTASASNGLTLSLSAGAAGAVSFSGGTSSAALGSLVFGDSNGVSFGLNGSTMTASVGAAAAATYSHFFQPNYMDENTASSTLGLGTLGVQPFSLPVNLSFGQVNLIGSATVVPTSASNNWSVRLTNSTQALLRSAVYSITNSHFQDLYLFTRGSGVFSTELQTIASTRNSYITYYNITHSASATLTGASSGSLKVSQQISVSISYPMITSSTFTSINPASSYTGWGTGYTTWTSTASNSSSSSMVSSAAVALSVASTFPAAANWSSYKLVPMNWATSLTPGEYYLGMVRYSSTSSSSTFGSSITGAAGTGASFSVTYNASGFTQTGQITWGGSTRTIVSSLGFLGFASQDTMGPEPGIGTFSATWTNNATYVNNLGNPNGAIAYSQIKTGVSFFQSWFQMASNRI